MAAARSRRLGPWLVCALVVCLTHVGCANKADEADRIIAAMGTMADDADVAVRAITKACLALEGITQLFSSSHNALQIIEERKTVLESTLEIDPVDCDGAYRSRDAITAAVRQSPVFDDNGMVADREHSSRFLSRASSLESGVNIGWDTYRHRRRLGR